MANRFGALIGSPWSSNGFLQVRGSCGAAGAVRFDVVAPSGKESIVGLAEAPQWFGEIALFDGGTRTHNAWADITSTLLHLPLRSLTKILADDPGAWQYMGRLLVQKLRIALSLLEDMGPGTSEGSADALPHQPVRGIRHKEGQAIDPRACLAGAAGDDALAQPPNRQRVAAGPGAGVDHSMSAGRHSHP
jgi:CRP-like cAMP-binding protein